MTISRRVRFILGGIALVVLAVLVWFFVLNPIRDDIKTTEKEIEEQRAQLSVAKATLAQAETTRAEGKRNQARLLELAKMVPPAPELPSLLLQIQDLADQSGIDFISISPGEPSQPQGLDYMIMPLELQFSGTFFDVSDFVYRAEQMVAGPGRLLAIKSINLTGETGTGTVSPRLSVGLSMLAYVLGQAPATQQTAAPAGTKGTTSQ
jgi:Tfp pilus assembly protein PilO